MALINLKRLRSDSSDSDLANIAQAELLCKVLVVGDYGVGKSAIVRRYTEDKFSSSYRITVGADFALKKIEWDARTKINLQLWDVPGHERFGHMTSVYFKYAAAAAIVFDVTRKNTFDSIGRWLQDIREKVFQPDGSDIPVVLLANKSDLNQTTVSGNQIIQFCRNNSIDSWFLTSAKKNANIDTAMNFLVESILKTRNISNFGIVDSFKLQDAESSKTNKWIRCNLC